MTEFEDVQLRDVYREVKRVNHRLRMVEVQLAKHRAEHRSLEKFKALLYPTMATIAGAVVAIVVK